MKKQTATQNPGEHGMALVVISCYLTVDHDNENDALLIADNAIEDDTLAALVSRESEDTAYAFEADKEYHTRIEGDNIGVRIQFPVALIGSRNTVAEIAKDLAAKIRPELAEMVEERTVSQATLGRITTKIRTFTPDRDEVETTDRVLSYQGCGVSYDFRNATAATFTFDVLVEDEHAPVFYGYDLGLQWNGFAVPFLTRETWLEVLSHAEDPEAREELEGWVSNINQWPYITEPVSGRRFYSIGGGYTFVEIESAEAGR